MSTELYLVGLVHFDSQGASRLEKILNHLRPRYVSVEWDFDRAVEAELYEEKFSKTEEGKQQYLDFIEGIAPNPHPDALAEFIRLRYFEYFTTRNYCREAGIPLVFTDNAKNLEIKEIVRAVQSYLNSSPSENNETVDEFYEQKVIEENAEGLMEMDMVNRDAFAEKVIRKLHRKSKILNFVNELVGYKTNDRIVQIGGLSHIYGNYRNLYHRLKDLNPTRMRLSEADKLSK